MRCILYSLLSPSIRVYPLLSPNIYSLLLSFRALLLLPFGVALSGAAGADDTKTVINFSLLICPSAGPVRRANRGARRRRRSGKEAGGGSGAAKGPSGEQSRGKEGRTILCTNTPSLRLWEARDRFVLHN